jgi:hypothetical protein
MMFIFAIRFCDVKIPERLENQAIPVDCPIWIRAPDRLSAGIEASHDTGSHKMISLCDFHHNQDKLVAHNWALSASSPRSSVLIYLARDQPVHELG